MKLRLRLRLRLLGVAAAGAVVGSVAMLGLQDEATSVTPSIDRPAAPPIDPLPAKTPTPTDGLVLAWTPGGLPPGLGSAVAAAPMVESLTVVRGDPVELTASAGAEGKPVGKPVGSAVDGMVIPLDAISIDPATYPATVPAAARQLFAALRDDEVVLGATSARLRGIGAGGTLTLNGGRVLTVAGVVEDVAVGGAEVAFTHEGGAASGVVTERSLLVTYDGERAAVEDAVRGLLAPAAAVRFRAPGETPFLRSSDAVLPQALVKDTFGEFAYRPPSAGQGAGQVAGPGAGRDVEIDPAWEAANIVNADVPLLGRVRCHRLLVPLLIGAMDELVRGGLAELVDPAEFDGCWNPRLVKAEGALSHHAWGAAFDLGYGDNPTGLASGQDERLVEVLARWGFTWGGPWLVPDPAHFEFLATPPAQR